MAKQKGTAVSKALSLLAWLTGVVVSLAVGFSMTGTGPLAGSIPYIPAGVTSFFGWVVVVTTIASTILAIIDALN